MRIAVVDDIADERKLLCSRLAEQFARRGVHADLFEYENGIFTASAMLFFPQNNDNAS